jgi:hypothetical protein
VVDGAALDDGGCDEVILGCADLDGTSDNVADGEVLVDGYDEDDGWTDGSVVWAFDSANSADNNITADTVLGIFILNVPKRETGGCG